MKKSFKPVFLMTAAVLLMLGLSSFPLTVFGFQDGADSRRPEVSEDTEMIREEGRPPMRPDRLRPMHIAHLLGKAIHDRIAANVLAEASGLTAEEILTDFGKYRISEILEKYGLTPDEFKTRMDAESAVFVEQAVLCGLISADQAEGLISMINRPNEGRRS